jgi:ABC-type glycerol-3-phosphate transport system permease component
MVTFEHYVKVITQMQDFAKFFRNTVIITIFSVAATVLFSAMTGYAFSKLQFWGKKVYLAFILLILTLPYAIYLIPIYILEDRMNLVNTFTGLILPYIAINLPMSIFIMRGQFNSIPNGLMEAATIDGCNFFQTWSKIMMPIAKPGLAIIVIFTFINVWGEFLFARTLTSTPATQTLAVGITFLRDEAASWQYGTLCATITMSLVPLLAIFLAMQKYFIRGIMEGALKG